MTATAAGGVSRWVWILAVCSVAITGLTIIGPPLAERAIGFYRGYQELKADESFRSVEHFYDLTHVARDSARSPTLAGLRRGQFAADELARSYSRSSALDWNYGNAIHYMHLVFGRLALADGDLNGARCHLLEAGKTPGSAQLDDYGPDMTLAQEMLERGERAAVLEYFAECDRFWLRREHNRLAEWTDAIHEGRLPEFGANSGLTPREMLR